MNNDTITPGTYQATVSAKTHISPDYYLLRFSMISPHIVAFGAGQYVSFHLGSPKLRHTMSIASPPNQDNEIDILQCVAPHGLGSQWAENLNTGDRVEFTGPLGKFTVNKESGKKKVFIATGCGIAPFRSMISAYLSDIRSDEVVLYWGMRYKKDLFWLDEWETLSAKYPSFHYFISLSKPEDSWTGLEGRITQHIFNQEQNLNESEFYLCGSREMIADIRKRLINAGVLEVQIFTETFF